MHRNRHVAEKTSLTSPERDFQHQAIAHAGPHNGCDRTDGLGAAAVHFPNALDQATTLPVPFRGAH